jgi:hypothetical protein
MRIREPKTTELTFASGKMVGFNLSLQLMLSVFVFKVESVQNEIIGSHLWFRFFAIEIQGTYSILKT